MPAGRVVWYSLLLPVLAGCTLLTSYPPRTDSDTPRDVATDEPVPGFGLEVAPAPDGARREARPVDLGVDRRRDSTPWPPQGKTCKNNNWEFLASAPPTAQTTLAWLEVSGPDPWNWVMGLVKTKLAAGGVDCVFYATHKVGAQPCQELTSSAECWRFPNVPVPGGDRFAFTFLKDATNDTCKVGVEVGWCVP